SRAKRLGMLLSSSCCHLPCHSSCHGPCHGPCHGHCDVKCFDPHDVCVSVHDGKVTVHAEHKDECDTGCSKSCSYRRFTKEFCLPPCEEEVTYSE
ncbi:ODFP1 protein, partial [Oenanthe oenanthe]|nr:ODFP1 protein [Oenanthe oenanthe]